MASNSAFDNKTSALEVARTYSSQARGKTVLITGVSKDGIGEAIARAFAYGGASTIIITGRDDTRLSSITKDLSIDYPSVKLQPHKLDLTSLEATRRSANELLEDETIPKIDIVVANAGGSFHGPRTVTPDGLESHLAINHLSHYLFVTTLLPKLRLAAQQSAPGDTRVVVMSSLATVVSPFRFADYNLEGKPVPADEAPNWAILKQLLGLEEHEGYDSEVAYGQSKTANALFAVHLNTLFSSEGIFAFALHPGGVQSRAAKKVLGAMTEEQRAKVTIPFDKDIDQGAATPLVAALDRGLTPEKGVFLNDCQVMDAPPYAVSKENAQKLWKLSEEIIAQKLGSAV
ncbi:retinol dehydrogenase 12 [Paraphoma chrysanthemicola]|nr:retinol dehydrogenase 12 [Paraphoma chrysanthemicola]